MAQIPNSVFVTGVMAPSDSADTYAVTDPKYGIDGLRNVANIQERNAIPNDRRRRGMIVGVNPSGDTTTEYWRLLPQPWNGTDSDWVIFQSGSGGGGGDSTQTQLQCKTFNVSTSGSTTILYNNCNKCGCNDCECILVSYSNTDLTPTNYIRVLYPNGKSNNKTKYEMYLYESTSSWIDPFAEVSWDNVNSRWNFKYANETDVIGYISNPFRPVVENGYTWTNLSPSKDSINTTTLTTCEAVSFSWALSGSSEQKWVSRVEGIYNSEPFYLLYSTTYDFNIPNYIVRWNNTKWQISDITNTGQINSVVSENNNPDGPLNSSGYTWSGNSFTAMTSTASSCSNVVDFLRLRCNPIEGECPLTFSGSGNNEYFIEGFLGLTGSTQFSLTSSNGDTYYQINDGANFIYSATVSNSTVVTLSPYNLQWGRIKIITSGSIESSWSFSASCPSNILEAGTEVETGNFEGQGYPRIIIYDTDSYTGPTNFLYRASTVPDRFMVYTYTPNGTDTGQENLIFDSGWMGGDQFNYGGPNRDVAVSSPPNPAFTTALSGFTDPIINLSYPIPQQSWNDSIAPDGFPYVINKNSNIPYTFTYNHLASYTKYVIVKVYGLPNSSTGWLVNLQQPSIPYGSQVCETILNSTTCPEVVFGDAFIQCEGLYSSSSNGGGGTISENILTESLILTKSVTQTINHNLNVRPVMVQIWDSNYKLINGADIVLSDENNVSITVATTGLYHIIIVG
jgi:hypothetical protein